ncbi:hypothetical protein L195_g024091 [Trifolium pratense]|uniref:Uncharacterized protein n=1 Tax=Trifolium pratense TaxID=57577 RepID=A0A2K3NCP9_TRIPR|nr:hypothetical protein L195_g024091 [Trifolium pratense]
MAPSPFDPFNQEPVAVRKKNNGPPIKFLVPLIYAPVLPLIRLSLRHKPVLRDRLFTAVLAGAFAHAFDPCHRDSTEFYVGCRLPNTILPGIKIFYA